ncbi:class II aldolase/adducin family protein [Steroidobacter agaridevorans]|uniref:class II aldolase/adducin family protein n=1 Tax=Steroidobacter agaridevorans TaxID=2695856 RepID=UPI00132A6C21|nr:class II aldolase/adducin family protein [Steroidobacter agaridevorans]GFE90530.1 fuculose phosphate aldolase [Steroidobacter agaridevorans]
MSEVRNIDRLIRTAGRALARHGLLHAYGHCSVRTSAATFRVSPSKPLGLVRDDDACHEVSLDGPLPDGVLGEVRAHREIYRLRPDVNAIVRCMPPKVMSLGAMRRVPRPRHGFGSYFYPAPVLWDDPQLLRDDEQARKFAVALGQQRAILMRGNGAVIVGEALEAAVVLTWYLEDAARVELDCLAAGLADEGLLTEQDAKQRATWSGRILERMWDYLTAE